MNAIPNAAAAPPGRVRPSTLSVQTITQMLTRLEQAAVASEAAAQVRALAAKRAGTQATVAVLGLLAGVVAIPLFGFGMCSTGLGILLIVAGLLAYFTQNGQRNMAAREQAQCARQTDALRLRMIPLRNALPLAGDPTIDDAALTALLGGAGWDAPP